MRTAFTFLIFILSTAATFGQLPKKVMKKMGQNPTLFLDSVETDMSELQVLDPFDISNISMINPKKAKKLLGDKGVDGAIYITTAKSAKFTYWNYFRSKSAEYRQLLPTPKSDTIVQYVLNGKVLSDSAAPGSLFLITDKNFKSIAIVKKEKLLGDLVSKRYVVSITAKRPKGLVKTSNSR